MHMVLSHIHIETDKVHGTIDQDDTNDGCGYFDLPCAVHVLDAYICKCW